MKYYIVSAFSYHIYLHLLLFLLTIFISYFILCSLYNIVVNYIFLFSSIIYLDLALFLPEEEAFNRISEVSPARGHISQRA